MQPNSMPRLSPPSYVLHPNFPNPFNPVTDIQFAISKVGTASLIIYDISGKRVKTIYDGDIKPGTYHFQWQGQDDRDYSVASGIYLYRLAAKNAKGFQVYQEVRRMVLLK